MSVDRTVRIGDAERDTAAAALSEHYASGRLTKAEYDERLEAIWASRFEADLQPVFVDLPSLHSMSRAPQPPAARTTPGRDVFHYARLLWLAPLLMIGVGAVAFTVLLGAPWLLFIALAFFACGGFGRTCNGRARRHGPSPT